MKLVATFAGPLPATPVVGLAWRDDQSLAIATWGEAAIRTVHLDEPRRNVIDSMALPFAVTHMTLLARDRYAAISDDATLHIGELATGTTQQTTPVSKYVYALLASRDGERLAWADASGVSYDFGVVVWTPGQPAPITRTFRDIHSFENRACVTEGARGDVWAFFEWDVVICDGQSGDIIAQHHGSRSACFGNAFIDADGAFAVGVVCSLNRDDDPIHPQLMRYEPATRHVTWAFRVEDEGAIAPLASHRSFVYANRVSVAHYRTRDGELLARHDYEYAFGRAVIACVSPNTNSARIAIGTELGNVLVFEL